MEGRHLQRPMSDAAWADLARDMEAQVFPKGSASAVLLEQIPAGTVSALGQIPAGTVWRRLPHWPRVATLAWADLARDMTDIGCPQRSGAAVMRRWAQVWRGKHACAFDPRRGQRARLARSLFARTGK